MTFETRAAGRERRRSGLFSSPPPSLAIEIARDKVAAVALGDSGSPPLISAYAFEPLAEAVVDPSLNAPNVLDAQALVAVLKTVVGNVAPRARRAALVLPDTVGKVSLLRFEKVPAKAQDLDQLIRWQVRKAAPFRLEDAQLSWIAGMPLAEGGREFLVTLARRDVIQSYEQACEAAGVHAGLVDLTTFNLINAVLATTGGPDGDWLLVNYTTDYVTIAVVRGQELAFFRNRAAATEAELADMVHQTAMYHEDRLGGGAFTRVVLAGAWMQGNDRAERLRRGIADRVGGRVESVDFRAVAALHDRIAVNPGLLDALAPAVGVLLRDRVHLSPAASERVA